MSMITTDDASTWGYAYDTTGGAPAPIAGADAVRPDPTREYVSGGAGFGLQGVPASLPETIDDLTRQFGFKAYDAMLTHPAIWASAQTLRLGIMAGDITLVETDPMSPGQKAPSEEQRMAGEIKDFVQRLIDRVPGFRSSLMQMYDCPFYGNKLGEMVGRVEDAGVDAGKMVLRSFKVKKRETWQFIVDESYEVTGILARRPSGGYLRIPPEKFVWFSWMPRDNDPRGTSILRAAYAAWNMAIQLYPEYYKALKQFASPSLLGKTAPGAPGQTLEGRLVTAEEFLLSQLVRYHNGAALVVPAGTEVGTLQVGNTGGSAFLDAFNFLNQEMVYSMLLQTRATKEAQFGSKADAQQGGDILSLLTEYGRDMGTEALRNSMFKYFVRLNYGAEVAERFTPYAYLGQGEPQDIVNRWNAVANLYRAKAVTESMKPELHAKANLPIPDPEIDGASDEQDPEAQPGEEPTASQDGPRGD